ncbi:MAG: endolytic transglycosylase MltG [Oscillospiraceae bacterium]|nr:endolytic transglycosylase MltG [Oscillospiraceae bacterium]
MPKFDDGLDKELEEIKRLINGDGATGLPLSQQKTDSLKQEPVYVDLSQSGKRQPGVEGSPTRGISGASSPKPQLPAVRYGSGPPQRKNAPGAPATRQPPSTPQTAPPPGLPTAQQKRRPPAKPVQMAPPEKIGEPEKVRAYDVSTNGRITPKSGSKQDEEKLDIGSEKFKINFDFDSAYKDVPEERPLRFRREKRTGCVGGLLYGAAVISVSLLLATLLWAATVDVLGFGEDDEQVNITVPTNFTIETVTDMLYEAGLVKYKMVFNIYATFSKAEEKIKPGSYVLNRNFDYRALVQGMTARAGVRVETTVTIPEGYTMAQIFTLLEDYGVCSANELWDTAANYDFNYSFLDKASLGDRHRLEGFLFPETHNFYIGSTPTQVLTTLLREFSRRFTEEYERRAEDMGYSVRDIITVASMIEREAGNDEERPRIAAVIYNRLDSKDFPTLQIDATIRYAIAGTDVSFSTDIDTPYNTYIYEGLPPGPISNPGMPSILAALYPDSTDEYYYARNQDGAHNFFKTLAQHEAFVNSDEYGG